MKTINPDTPTLTFEDLNLHPLLLKALNQCNYKHPTQIQAQAIPQVLAGQDVIASAQTGTGKTAAFLLPALHHILTKSVQHKKPRILILSPTRELAQQIEKSAHDYSRNIRMSSACLVGGMPYPQQIKALAKPLDLIIATPGRLIDHLERNRVDLSAIELLVLDEADRMLDMGFVDDVELIASKCNKQRQTMLFSATIDRQMENFAKALLKTPVRIKVEAELTNSQQIQQSVYFSDDIQHKIAILKHILQQEAIFKGIIFTATKSSADDLADELYEQGYKAAAMHGDMKQSRRNKTLEQLRNGRLQLIIATDVAARGIDINSITHVVNFDMPRFAEDYVHRIGRTGRAGQKGSAITFVSHNERSFLQKIEKYIGQPIAQTVIEGLEPKAKFEKNNKPKAKRGYERHKAYAKKGAGKLSSTRSQPKSDGRKFNQPHAVEEGMTWDRSRTESQQRPRVQARQDYADRSEGGRYRARQTDRSEGRYAARQTDRSEGRYATKQTDRSEGRYVAKQTDRSEGRYAAKQTDRSEGRYTARQTDRSEGRYTARQTDRSEGRYAARQTDRSEGRYAARQTDRREGRDGARQTDRSEGRYTARQTDRTEGRYAARQTDRAEGRYATKQMGRAEGRHTSTKPKLSLRKKKAANY